jgi:hypothetical protein
MALLFFVSCSQSTESSASEGGLRRDALLIEAIELMRQEMKVIPPLHVPRNYNDREAEAYRGRYETGFLYGLLGSMYPGTGASETPEARGWKDGQFAGLWAYKRICEKFNVDPTDFGASSRKGR